MSTSTKTNPLSQSGDSSNSKRLDPDIHKDFPIDEKTGKPVDGISEREYKEKAPKPDKRKFRLYLRDYKNPSKKDDSKRDDDKNPSNNIPDVQSNEFKVNIEYELYNHKREVVEVSNPERNHRRLLSERTTIKYELCKHTYGRALAEGIVGMRKDRMRQIVVFPDAMAELGHPPTYGVYVVKLDEVGMSKDCINNRTSPKLYWHE